MTPVEFLAASGVIAWAALAWRLTRALGHLGRYVHELPRRLRWAVLGPSASRRRRLSP